MSHIRFTFLFTTLVATRLRRCLLRSDFMWAVMPDGLRHVISGILAGGIPGFRMVLLLLRSPSGMALWLWCSSLLFLLPYHVKMIQCYHLCINLPMNWHLSRLCLAFLFWVAVFFALFVWVCFWFLFLLLACDDFVTDWTTYRSATSSLLRPLNLQAAIYALIS